MMRSLYSGVSGLKVHQTKMDVIGNNIANVNTIGFKSSSVNFADIYYQNLSSATGPNANTGAAGINAKQIGLGSSLASINVNITGTGGTQRTERGLDLMINGDAFFIVQSAGQTYFTKAGAMNVDPNGNLYCTSNGATVMGWQADENGNIIRDTVSALKITSPDRMFIPPEATTYITLSGNIVNKDSDVAYDTEKNGLNVPVNFYDRLGNSFTMKLGIMLVEGSTNEYTVNITDIVEAGADGKSEKSIIAVQNAADGTYSRNPLIPEKISFGGEECTVTVDPTTGKVTITPANPLILEFNSSTGAFVNVGEENGKTLNVNLSNAGNTFPTEGMDIDFSSLTMYGQKSNKSSVEPIRGDAEGARAGLAAGKLGGFVISEDGKIYGTYSNGLDKCFGQIALATFANPSGLESVGNSLFRTSLNSGDFDGVGVDPDSIGGISTGSLEMANVDLATEFTNMITTQRGFQANSRIITTSDSILEELISLKR